MERVTGWPCRLRIPASLNIRSEAMPAPPECPIDIASVQRVLLIEAALHSESCSSTSAERRDSTLERSDQTRSCRRRFSLHQGLVPQQRETDLRWPKMSTARLNSAVLSKALDIACRAGSTVESRVAAPMDGMSKEQTERAESQVRRASGTP